MGAKTSTGGCFVLPTVTAHADIQSDLARVTAAPRRGRERTPRTAATCPRLHELPHLAPPRAAATRLHSSMTSFAHRAWRAGHEIGRAAGRGRVCQYV